VEKRSVPSNALMLHGLPDVGLVGLIATSHIISQLKLNVDAKKMTTRFKRGILEVHLPRKKGYRIKVE